jgi:hypothetical protein
MIELWRAQHRLRPPKKERPAHFLHTVCPEISGQAIANHNTF